MKTSNMLLLTSVLVVLGCLTAYNFGLKAIYQTKDYKNEFSGMTFSALNGVEKLILKSANLMDVQIKKGNKEGVWVNKKLKDRLDISIDKQTASIGLAARNEKEELREPSGIRLIIFTKNLNSVITNSIADSGKVEDHAAHRTGSIEIRGYHSDNFQLTLSPATEVSMDYMQLNNFQSVVGTKTGYSSSLILASDNKINAAQFDIPGNGGLVLNNPKIIKAKYNLSERASVSLDGKVVQQLK